MPFCMRINMYQEVNLVITSSWIIFCTWHISSFVTYCPTVKHPRIQVDLTRFTSWYMFILMQKGIKVRYDMIPTKLILKKFEL